MVRDRNNDFGENVAFRSTSKRHAGRVGRTGVVSIAPESKTENLKISEGKKLRPCNTDTSHSYTHHPRPIEYSGKTAACLGANRSEINSSTIAVRTKIVRKPV